MRPRLLPAVLAIGIVLAACGEEATTSSSTQAPSTTTVAPPTDTTTPTTTASTSTTDSTTGTISTTSTTTEAPMPTSSVPDGIPTVEQAIADLAGRLGVDPDEIEVVTVGEVTWPDGSIGCPRPGMVYTQALVDGTLIVLAVDGTVYEYHAGRDGKPFYCPADRITPPAGGIAPNT